jgi:excisionase family DNA binding protein
MTQAEAAARLHVTTRTIRKYVAAGWLPAYRLGKSRATRYERADVEALLVRIPTVEPLA